MAHSRLGHLQVSDAQALMQALGAHAASEVLGMEGRPVGAQRSHADGIGFGPAHAFLPPASLGAPLSPPAVARRRCTLCLCAHSYRPIQQTLAHLGSWQPVHHNQHTSSAFTKQRCLTPSDMLIFCKELIMHWHDVAIPPIYQGSMWQNQETLRSSDMK